jgi:hypothetical protein
MKHMKMLALAAVAAGALMAFIGAGSASATVLCSTTVEPCPAGQKVTGVLNFSVASGGHLVALNTAGETFDSCTSATMKGSITNSGSSTATVTGPVEETTWGGSSFPTNTITKGKLEVHKIAGTSNGTVTADGTFEVTINTVFFGSCIYGFTSGVDIGELTEGNPAVLHVNAVDEKFSGSNFACPETTKWTGTYNLTTPATTVSVGNS